MFLLLIVWKNASLIILKNQLQRKLDLPEVVKPVLVITPALERAGPALGTSSQTSYLSLGELKHFTRLGLQAMYCL